MTRESYALMRKMLFDRLKYFEIAGNIDKVNAYDSALSMLDCAWHDNMNALSQYDYFGEEDTPKEVGYRWYIQFGNGEKYEPNEEMFATCDEAFADGIRSGYSPDYIGVDKAENNDGWIDVIENIKKPNSVVYFD